MRLDRAWIPQTTAVVWGPSSGQANGIVSLEYKGSLLCPLREPQSHHNHSTTHFTLSSLFFILARFPVSDALVHSFPTPSRCISPAPFFSPGCCPYSRSGRLPPRFFSPLKYVRAQGAIHPQTVPAGPMALISRRIMRLQPRSLALSDRTH